MSLWFGKGSFLIGGEKLTVVVLYLFKCELWCLFPSNQSWQLLLTESLGGLSVHPDRSRRPALPFKASRWWYSSSETCLRATEARLRLLFVSASVAFVSHLSTCAWRSYFLKVLFPLACSLTHHIGSPYIFLSLISGLRHPQSNCQRGHQAEGSRNRFSAFFEDGETVDPRRVINGTSYWIRDDNVTRMSQSVCRWRGHLLTVSHFAYA